jgi:hypothetical protein
MCSATKRTQQLGVAIVGVYPDNRIAVCKSRTWWYILNMTNYSKQDT